MLRRHMPITLHHMSPVVPAFEGLSPSCPPSSNRHTTGRRREGLQEKGKECSLHLDFWKSMGGWGREKAQEETPPRLGGFLGGLGGWVGGLPRRQRGRGQRGGRRRAQQSTKESRGRRTLPWVPLLVSRSHDHHKAEGFSWRLGQTLGGGVQVQWR